MIKLKRIIIVAIVLALLGTLAITAIAAATEDISLDMARTSIAQLIVIKRPTVGSSAATPTSITVNDLNTPLVAIFTWK